MADWKVPGYTELKRLGSGGFGQVMLAKHDASSTLVAIKYLRPDLLAEAEFTEMFRAEATVLASLDDPNVVRLYEYVESPAGAAAIVMELIGGVTLREILTFQGSTTAEAALMVLQGSLLGLAAAHRRGVVHRDFKPENVLVNGDGVSKLTDFGIAARTGDRPVPAGTLQYAAPEQMAGALASPASDIYAATATFYECLTGRPPYHGETADLIRQHNSEPVPLELIPGPLRPLVTAGMAKDPAERPTDATAFVTELSTAASRAYGRDWSNRGRSHLAEAALLLAALWPTGPPPAVQGATVQGIRLRRRTRLRHVSAGRAAFAASVTIAVAAAAAALAATVTTKPEASNRPAPVVRSVSLQPSPTLTTTPIRPSPQTGEKSLATSRGGGGGTSTGGGGGTSTGGGGGTSTGGGGGTSTGGGGGTSAAAPEITSVGTYTQGVFVYFDIHYSDPGNNAEGFGFVGVNGSGWAEENHPFSSPSYGIVSSGGVAYPFNEGCGTAQQYASYVQAWIYDTDGNRSTPVTIHLVCTS